MKCDSIDSVEDVIIDTTSTEYSIVGQTSSISTSANIINGIVDVASSSGTGGSTKHYVPVTQIPKVIQKRTGNIADSKIKVTIRIKYLKIFTNTFYVIEKRYVKWGAQSFKGSINTWRKSKGSGE